MRGNLNRYPFDRYESDIWLYADTPPPPQAPEASQVPQAKPPQVKHGLGAADEELALDKDSLQKNVPVPLSIALSASTTGVKYTGEVVRNKDSTVTRVHLNLTRPFNVINTVITVMILMMGLAQAVVAMVINRITAQDRSDLLPLSLAISLIFGLPALRSIQPGVPVVGVLGDYFSFIWAELFVAASAIIMMWIWLLRSKKSTTQKS